MEERQNSLNPFLSTQKYPNRPNPSPFTKLPKITLKRRRTVKATPRKVKRNYTPSQWVTFTTQPKTEESVQTQQIESLLTVVKLPTATATNPNAVTIPAST